MMKKLLPAILFSAAGIFGFQKADAQCIASFTWSQSTANQIDFISNSQNFTIGSTIYQWSWGDNNSGWSNGSNTISHTYQIPGNYYVCMTMYDSATQCSSTFCDSVTVTGNILTSSCNADFSVYLDSVNTNQAWIYDQSTGTGTLTYEWFWGDNTSDTAHYASHVYAQTGSYNVCLVVTDAANLCSDTACHLLMVVRLSQQAQSVPFYVNVVGGGPLGVSEQAANGFELYPNPAQNEITITSGSTPLYGKNFRIADLTGRIVDAGTMNGNHVRIAGLESGMYILLLENNDGTFTSKRFIKE